MSAADQDIAQERREDCRRHVLRFLAERPAGAHHAKTVRQKLNAGHEADYELEEIVSALAFLTSTEPARVKEIPAPMGSTKYFQATAAGVLAHERGN
jgi:hypothetical protein